MTKKKRSNAMSRDPVSVICQKTGLGKSVARSMFNRLNSSQRALITPASRSEQIMQMLNSPHPEPRPPAPSDTDELPALSELDQDE